MTAAAVLPPLEGATFHQAPAAGSAAKPIGGVGLGLFSQDDDKAAEEAKTRGNAFFAKGDFLHAAQCFTEAINLSPNNHLYLTNRSAALLKLARLEEVISPHPSLLNLLLLVHAHN